jgi:hypothetical protein
MAEAAHKIDRHRNLSIRWFPGHTLNIGSIEQVTHYQTLDHRELKAGFREGHSARDWCDGTPPNPDRGSSERRTKVGHMQHSVRPRGCNATPDEMDKLLPI